MVEVPAELAPYLDELVERVGGHVPIEAAYLLGSAATGAFEPGQSDVDVIVVTPRQLSAREKQVVVDEIDALPCPARTLELAVYARGRDEYELNFIKGEFVSYDAARDPSWWYVLERATAEAHAVQLAGPPWREVFAPVPREAILDALVGALDWQEQNESTDRGTLLNNARALAWLETGEWLTKPEAARWLRRYLRTAIEAAR